MCRRGTIAGMSSAPTWIHVFIDVPREEWARSVTFWCAAAGGSPSASWGDEGQYLTVVPPEGDGWVHLQAIDGPPRVHVDLDSTDREAAREHSLSLGAQPEWVRDEAIVMRSPGGILFCHSRDGRREMVRTDPERVLDQVCLDIPASSWEQKVAFWRDLTGRDLTKGGEPEFSFLGEEGQVRILLQRLDEQDGAVRAHLDFATADRAGETRRHELLGASLVDVYPWWTVLRAPDGHVYCLTDRDPLTGSVRPR